MGVLSLDSNDSIANTTQWICSLLEENRKCIQRFFQDTY
jgi:hypothetical protein